MRFILRRPQNCCGACCRSWRSCSRSVRRAANPAKRSTHSLPVYGRTRRRKVFARYFRSGLCRVTPDARVLGAMQHAPEYGKPFGAYVESIVSPSRVAIGTRKIRAMGRHTAQDRDQVRRAGEHSGQHLGHRSSFGDSADRWTYSAASRHWRRQKSSSPISATELISALKSCSRTRSRAQCSLLCGPMGQPSSCVELISNMPSISTATAVPISGRAARRAASIAIICGNRLGNRAFRGL